MLCRCDEQTRAHRLPVQPGSARHQREAGDRRPHRHAQIRRARGQGGDAPKQPQRGTRRAGQDDAVGDHDLLSAVGHWLVRRRRPPPRRRDTRAPGAGTVPVSAFAAGRPQPLGADAGAHAATTGLDRLAQRVGEPEQPALDGRVHAPTARAVPAVPTPLQHRRHGGTERPQLRSGPPQSGYDDVGGQVGRIGRVDAGDDRAHEPLQDACPHPRGHEGGQVGRVLRAGAHRPGQLGVPRGPAGGGLPNDGDDVGHQRIRRNPQIGILRESVQRPIGWALAATCAAGLADLAVGRRGGRQEQPGPTARCGGAQAELGQHRGGRLAAHHEALGPQVQPRPADRPGRHEPTGVAARLDEQRPQPGAHQVPGRRQPRDPAADDERVPPLNRRLRIRTHSALLPSGAVRHAGQGPPARSPRRLPTGNVPIPLADAPPTARRLG